MAWQTCATGLSRRVPPHNDGLFIIISACDD